MAFMEKPAAGKVLLDDTVPLTAVIEASQSLHSHTVSQASGAGGPGWSAARARRRLHPGAARGRGVPWKKPRARHGEL